MRFMVKYIFANSMPHTVPDSYYRQVTADTQNEARKIAGRYERKGYRLASMTQINDNNA